METFLLPFFSVILGFLLVFLLKIRNKKNIKLLLAFSGAFLLGMTIFTLIPEVFDAQHHSHEPPKKVGLWIVIGIFLQIILEFFSKGAEHGHMHKEDNSFLTFPWLLFFSLSLHSVLEGMPLHHHHNMAYGIFVHHLPIAMVLTAFFLDAKMSTAKTLGFLLLFSLMTPLGTFLALYLPQMPHYQMQTSAIVVGIFLHISSVILFETSENHKFNIYKLTAITVGFILAYFM